MDSYCTKCGAPVPAGSQFCTGCGLRVGTPAVAAQGQANAAPPPPAPSAGERVLGTLMGLYRGLVGTERRSLVVTDRRLILANFNAQAATDAAMKAREEAKAGGAGFLRQALNSTNAYTNLAEHYAGTHPDQIVAETNGNFAIPLAEVSKIKIRTMTGMIQIGFVGKTPKIRIVWAGGNTVYCIESPMMARDGAQLLKGVLGDKVKTTILWV